MAMLVITRGWVVFFTRLQWIRRREFEPSSVQCLLFVAVLSSQNSNDFDLMTLIYWHYPSVVQYMTRMIYIAHYYSGGFFLLFRLVFFSNFHVWLLLILLLFLLLFLLLCFSASSLFRFSAFFVLSLLLPLSAFPLFRFYLSSPKATPKISESIRPKPTQNKLDSSLE